MQKFLKGMMHYHVAYNYQNIEKFGLIQNMDKDIYQIFIVMWLLFFLLNLS